MLNLLLDLDPDFHIIGKRYINVLQVCCHLVAMSSACYNPFIYASLHSKMRMHLKGYLCPCRNRQRGMVERAMSRSWIQFKLCMLWYNSCSSSWHVEPPPFPQANSCTPNTDVNVWSVQEKIRQLLNIHFSTYFKHFVTWHLFPNCTVSSEAVLNKGTYDKQAKKQIHTRL